jgi:hypothetical protein
MNTGLGGHGDGENRQVVSNPGAMGSIHTE